MKYGLNTIKTDSIENDQCHPTLIFLNYWDTSSNLWKAVMEALREEFRCVILDYKLEKNTPSYQLADLANYTLKCINKLKLEQYVLIGHHLDGKLAQFIGGLRPPGLEALILVTPALPVSIVFEEQLPTKNDITHIALQEDISEKIDKIEVPTLVLAGETNTIKCSEELSREVVGRISDSELQIIPHCGQYIPLEAPSELANSIYNFLHT